MMEKSSKSQIPNRQALWQSHIEAWSNSGLNQTDYCRANDLAPHQFSYWKHKVLGKSTQSSDNTAGFVRIRQVPHHYQSPGLSIALESGLVIHGIDQDNLTTVAQLIRAL